MGRDPPLSLAGTPFEHREFTHLWLLAAATYGVGDVVTTTALVNHSRRVSEANPVLSLAIETFGGAGLVGLKLLAFGLCLAVSLDAARAGDRLWYYLPPAALACVGAFVTAFNLRLLLG